GFRFVSLRHRSLVTYFHCFDRGPRMPRCLDLRNHGYMALLGIPQDVYEILPAQVIFCCRNSSRTVRRLNSRALREKRRTVSTDLCQLRQRRYLDTPSLVIYKMKVKRIELIMRHKVYIL